MKKFMFLFALTMAVAFLSSTAYAQEVTGITVNGEGAVTIVPDVASVSVGAETQDSSPLEAQRRNNVKISDVIAALKALGIDEADIRTTSFFMHPIQNWRDGVGEVVGYMVSNRVDVTVRDIDMVGAVLTAATEAGANASSNITFGLLDGTAAYNQALALAVANAQGKAQTIAGALGVNVGAAVDVVELSGARFVPRAQADMEMAAAAAPMAVADVPIQGGELTVTANIRATFLILP